jgi:dihydroorotase
MVNVFPVAAATKKMEGKELSEYGELRNAGAVALSDDGRPVMDSRIFRRAVEYAKDYDFPVIDHSEEIDLRGNGVMHEGNISCRLGLPGIPSEVESIMVARNIEIARLTGGRVHFAHISTDKSLKLIKAAKREKLNVTCEITPHHFTLTDEAVIGYDTNTKMNPPLRALSDVKACREAISRGTVDVIATDHAPHSPFEKNVEYDYAPFGIIGLETALSLTLSLVEKKVLDLPRMVQLMSTNPSKILGINRGRLSKGMPADITVFDPAASRTVYPETFFSKSRNTPFAGWKRKGEVLLTVVDGRVVYESKSRR